MIEEEEEIKDPNVTNIKLTSNLDQNMEFQVPLEFMQEMQGVFTPMAASNFNSSNYVRVPIRKKNTGISGFHDGLVFA